MKKRKIKFRAWDKVTKMMWNEKSFKPPSLLALFQWLDAIDDNDCTLMQFTGLKDKNSKEIFEGDVIAVIVELCKVKSSDGDWVMSTGNLDKEGLYENRKPSKIWKEEKTRTTIKWLNGSTTTGGGYNSEHHGGYFISFPYSNWYRIDQYEIIGNIYSNPELNKK